MKNHWIMSVLAVSGVLICAVQPVKAEEGVAVERHENQQKRIAQGVESGELTRGEAAHLKHGQHKVELARDKALADGSLSGAEKAKLTKMQKKQSKKIFRTKHNKKDRT